LNALLEERISLLEARIEVTYEMKLAERRAPWPIPTW
jgi:hypothetical protein